MKVPTFTKPKHWFWLTSLVILQAFLAFVCFIAGKPIAIIGIILIIAANIEVTAAMILGIVNTLKQGNSGKKNGK